MISTLIEAKAKACCGPQQSTCIANACMAWRWAQKPNPDYKSSNQVMVGWVEVPPSHITDHDHGYCGLAGHAR